MKIIYRSGPLSASDPGDSLCVYYEEKDDFYNHRQQIQRPQIVSTAHKNAKCINKSTKTLKAEPALNSDTLKATITSQPTLMTELHPVFND